MSLIPLQDTQEYIDIMAAKTTSQASATSAGASSTSATASALAAATSAGAAANYTSGMFKGRALPSTVPTIVAGVPQWWLGSGAGTYTNFGGLVATMTFVILSYSGSAWSKYEAAITLNILSEDLNANNKAINNLSVALLPGQPIRKQEFEKIALSTPGGRNLFDKAQSLFRDGGYYNNTNVFLTNALYCMSPVVKVEAFTNYCLSPFSEAAFFPFTIFTGFDDAFNAIEALTATKTTGNKVTVTTSANTKYISWAITKINYPAYKDQIQLEVGSNPTAYDAYIYDNYVKAEKVIGLPKLTLDINTLSNLTTSIPAGKNLFNKDAPFWKENGYYQNGAWFVNATFIATPVVEVKQLTNYCITPFKVTNTFSDVYCIDDKGNYIGSATLVEKVVGTRGYGVYVTKRYTKYISMGALRTVYDPIVNEIQVEEGLVQTAHEDYIPNVFIDSLKIVNFASVQTNIENSIIGIRAKFPSPTYPGISDKFPNFREAVFRKNKDAIVCLTGTSLTQGTRWASIRGDATTRPPLLHTNDFASAVYDKLVKLYPGQQNMRYDNAFFIPIGATWEVKKTDTVAAWDNGNEYIEGYTKLSSESGAGVSFAVPSDAWRFNFIYRTDSTGDTCTVSITEGNVKMEVWNGTSWVEANGFQFSMLEPTATATKGNTIYQKRLNMRCKNKAAGGINSIGIVKNVTITKGANTTQRFLLVGAEWSKAEFVLQIINGARGSHNWGTGTLDLSKFQDSDLWVHKPNLLLAEITTINWAGSNKASLVTSPENYVTYTKRFYFNALNDAVNSIHSKTSGFTTCDVIFYNDTITGDMGASGPWNADGTITWGNVATVGELLGMARTCYSSYEFVDNYVMKEQPNYAFVSLNRHFREVAEKQFGTHLEGMLATGATGVTLSNDAIHYNDNGAALIANVICPMFDFN